MGVSGINVWEAYGIGEAGDRYGVSKTIINEDGKYQPVFYRRTYASLNSANKIADGLNNGTVTPIFRQL